MGGTCGITRTRLLVSTAAVVLAAALFSEPAFAQLPLDSGSSGAEPSLGSTLDAVTQTVSTDQIARQTAPVVEQVTQPVAQVTAPVTTTAAPVVQAVTAPVVQAVAPVLQQAAPVIQQTTAPVLDAVAPVLEMTQPVVNVPTTQVGGVTGVRLEAPASGSGDTQATAPASGTTQSTAAAGTAGLVAAPVPYPGDTQPPLSGEHRVAPYRTVRPSGQVAGGVVERTSVTERTSAPHSGQGARAASAPPPRPQSPSAPDGPLGLLVEFAAPYGSSALLLFVAILAAFSLAAPGLGRWLRSRQAPWPLPIPPASLERPG